MVFFLLRRDHSHRNPPPLLAHTSPPPWPPRLGHFLQPPGELSKAAIAWAALALSSLARVSALGN
jgi:hypothetical protein